MSEILLYNQGAEAKQAFLVEKGRLYVKLFNLDPAPFRSEGIIVGAMEHFLETLNSQATPRLFSLSISSKGKYTSIPYNDIYQLMLDDHFGFNTNIFIAELIQYFTSYLTGRSKAPLGLFKKYQRRAGSFARTVDRLMDLSIRHKFPDLQSLVEGFRKHEVYIDGSIHRHYRTVEAIASPGDSKSKYVISFKKNAYISREGSEAKELYILLKGSINVTQDKLFVATINTPGQSFGEMALFLNNKRTASLVADEDSLVYVIPFDKVRIFAKQKCPDLFYKTAQVLSERLSDTLQKTVRIESLALKSIASSQDASQATIFDNIIIECFDKLKNSLIEIHSRTSSITLKSHLRTYIDSL